MQMWFYYYDIVIYADLRLLLQVLFLHHLGRLDEEKRCSVFRIACMLCLNKDSAFLAGIVGRNVNLVI